MRITFFTFFGWPGLALIAVTAVFLISQLGVLARQDARARFNNAWTIEATELTASSYPTLSPVIRAWYRCMPAVDPIACDRAVLRRVDNLDHWAQYIDARNQARQRLMHRDLPWLF